MRFMKLGSAGLATTVLMSGGLSLTGLALAILANGKAAVRQRIKDRTGL